MKLLRMRWLGRILTVASSAILACYLLLLGMEVYSAWQASRTLDRVEALRIGDSYADFERAVEQCALLTDGSDRFCGVYRIEPLWTLIWKLPGAWPDRIQNLSNHIGLRFWDLKIASSVEDGRIRSISVRLYVVGRYEALGARWWLAAQMPTIYERTPVLNVADRRTHIGWYHITSLPSGEGVGISATPASRPKELLARRINRRCFLSFRGCDGLCELLPEAVAVLNERNESWGGCTDVPRSRCELKNDICHAAAASP